jgi:2-polyprenyl-6-methoxyphenol hydroxylase-like FAD-dependent oxidoreductase
MDISYYTRLTGWELGRIRQPSEAEKRRAVAASAATDQVPEPLLRANQMYVEMFLFDRMRESPNITIQFGWEADKFDDDADGVTVEATDGTARETWRARYLVGADGGRSFVRRSLALRYGGFGKLDSPHYGGRMNATYLRAPTFYRDILVDRPGWQYWTINPEARATIISLNRDDEFLVFSKGDDSGRVPADAEMVAHVQRAIGAEIPIHVIGHWPWTAGIALVAQRCRAPFHADRRFRHEHRRGRCLQPRLETRGAGTRLGRNEPAAILRNRAPADRGAQHHRGARTEQAPRQYAGAHRDRRGIRSRRNSATRGR